MFSNTIRRTRGGIDFLIASTLEETSHLNQYILWWLGREPNQRDFDRLNNFLKRNKAKLIRASRNAIDYRIFDKIIGSIHIIIRRKYFGFALNIHRDIKVHSEVDYDNITLYIASRIYNFLNKVRYGKPFLLPRQDRDFTNYLRCNKKKWNLI